MSSRPQPRHQRPVEALQAYFAAVDPADGAWRSACCSANDASALLHRKALANRPGRLSSGPNGCFDRLPAGGRQWPKPIRPAAAPAGAARKPELIGAARWQSGWGALAGDSQRLRFTPRLKAVLITWAGPAAGPGASLFTAAHRWPAWVVVHRTGDTGLARLAGLEEARIAQRLMGGLEPSAERLPRPARPADGRRGGCRRARPIPSFWPAPSIRPSWRVWIQPIGGASEVGRASAAS